MGTPDNNAVISNQDLVNSITADGKVDASEVQNLRTQFFADGTIDRTEADTLFTINDAVSGKDNDPSWNVFFSEALSAHVLQDPTTPGVVSDEEAEYLKTRIHKDGNVDEAERALLQNLKQNAQGPVPASLQFLFDMYLTA